MAATRRVLEAEILQAGQCPAGHEYGDPIEESPGDTCTVEEHYYDCPHCGRIITDYGGDDDDITPGRHRCPECKGQVRLTGPTV